MLTRTSYRNSFYTSLNQGGVSNSLIINELISKYKGFRLRSVIGPRAEAICILKRKQQYQTNQI